MRCQPIQYFHYIFTCILIHQAYQQIKKITKIVNTKRKHFVNQEG